MRNPKKCLQSCKPGRIRKFVEFWQIYSKVFRIGLNYLGMSPDGPHVVLGYSDFPFIEERAETNTL